MNAVALKKFAEKNHRLAMECSNFLEACKKWKSECLLYDNYCEALMDFTTRQVKELRKLRLRTMATKWNW